MHIVLDAVYALCVMLMKLIRMVLAQADFQPFDYICFALELQFDVINVAECCISHIHCTLG